MINRVSSIKTPIPNQKYQPKSTVISNYGYDSFNMENPNLNKKVFIDRKIIKKEENINSFLDGISRSIFKNPNDAFCFSNLLKTGAVSLSSSCYRNLKDPSSAVGLALNPNKSIISHCAYIEDYINSLKGIGVNFSNLKNPTEEIKTINSYLKFRQPSLERPGAAIGLLDIYNGQIMDFIRLKDEADYNNWCFDLSVIMDNSFLDKVDNNETVILSDGKKIKAKDIYSKLLDSMLKSGEPGIIFSNNKNYITDCCAAAPLEKNEKLILAHINLLKFYDSENQKIDYNSLKNASNILSCAMKNIDSNGYIGILGYSSLLDSMNIKYGSKEAKDILDKCLKTIKTQCQKNNIKMAISPTGTISRFLKTSPSIEPNDNKDISYYDEIDTLSIAQKYLEGTISKTIKLKENYTIEDINNIIRYCIKKDIKGISVFPKQ